MNNMKNPEALVTASTMKMTARKVQVHYGTNHAIKDVDVDILDKTVTAFIGPSGCGKSTFLRCLNRMNDTIAVCKVSGKLELEGEDIYDHFLRIPIGRGLIKKIQFKCLKTFNPNRIRF